MRLARIHAIAATLFVATTALVSPASAAVANDEVNTATQIYGMPVVLNADATNATTSVTNGRPGCYRDMWYRLPNIASSSLQSKVAGGAAYIVPALTAAHWETATVVTLPADGTIGRWSSGSYLVLCRTADSAGTVSVSIDGQLSAPYPVSAIAGNTAFTASWGAGSNGESLISGYRVDYRVVGAPTWASSATLSTAARSYTVTGLVNGAQYEYRVWAVSSYGSSAALTAQTIWVGKPVNVAVVTARASYRAVIVDWAGSVETSVVKGMYLTLNCVGLAPQTYQSTGPTTGSHAFIGLAPGTVCAATGKWLGLYGFDATTSASTAAVTVLEYAGPTSVSISRVSGTSVVRWVLPTATLPTGTTVLMHRISVQCSNPTWSAPSVDVSATTTLWSSSGMALGATCVASVYSIYRDALGALGQSKPTMTPVTRLVDAPAQPALGQWKPTAVTSMAFPLTVPTSTGREPESVTVTEYRAGVRISTTVLTAASGWTYVLPVTEAAMNATETFTAVASNSAGTSTVLTWSTRIPSLPETLTASLFTKSYRAEVAGPRHIDLTVVNDASRPWMRDTTAKYVITTRNAVSGVERVIQVPVATTSIPDVGHFIPSISVQVALVTEMGSSAALTLVGGGVGPKPIARASVARVGATSARITWASVAAGGQLRVEVYRGKAFTRLLSVARSAGALNVTGLKAGTSYTFAVYTYDGSAFSAKPLLLKAQTAKR